MFVKKPQKQKGKPLFLKIKKIKKNKRKKKEIEVMKKGR